MAGNTSKKPAAQPKTDKPAAQPKTDKPAASRRPTSPDQRNDAKKKEEMAKQFMRTPLNFEPLTLDAGDGVVWRFSPDPMPAQSEELSRAMSEVSEASDPDGSGRGDLTAAYDAVSDAIKGRLLDEEQRDVWPLPIYGANALMWFALNVATGRDTFPTE